MCVTIEEATVDGHGCVGDEAEAENDSSMLVEEEERGLKNTVFGAWRNVMWRMVSSFIMYRSSFVSGVDPDKIKFV
jgi:hypothetical protein